MSSVLKKQKKVVLLLMTPSTYRASDFLSAARAAGLDIVVGTSQPQALADHLPRGHLTLPWDDPASALAQVEAFARNRPLDAVVGVDDEGVLLAAAVARRLGLAHNSPRSVARTLNKAGMRRCLRRAGIATPRFLTCAGPQDLSQVLSSVRFPCVVKPLHLSGSRGVIRVEDEEELSAALEQVAHLLKRSDLEARAERVRQVMETENEAESSSPDGSILVEEYIPGVEVALEGLLQEGKLNILALFDKPDPLVGPFFEETLYVTPSRLSHQVQAVLGQVAAQTARALGLTRGPVHGEFRVNSRGAWPLEMAARSIGGLCSRALQFGTGLSLEEIILRDACGLQIPSLVLKRPASGVMMIPIPAGGVLRSVSGQLKARGVCGIQEVLITIPEGGKVVPPPVGNRYLGFILAAGPSPQAVETALREAHGCLSFEIESIPDINA